MEKSLLFMIEGGKALDLVKSHIVSRVRCNEEVGKLIEELGVREVCRGQFDGKLTGVVFENGVPEGWTKPDKRHVSFPKKKTEWYERFAAQQGHPNPSQVIADAFNVPMGVSYRSATKEAHGVACIGQPFYECGFLYLSVDGPYAMWIPDVEAYVQKYKEDGYTVDEPAASFKPAIDGCRLIEEEEWEVLVAQHKLQKKLEEKSKAPRM